MPTYLVRWEIDVEADTPKEAAEKALAIHRRDDSIATVFDVREWFYVEGTKMYRDTMTIDLTPQDADAADVEEADEDPAANFRNFYRCERCAHEWDDVWSSQRDDDCPSCGARHMSPYKSEDA